MCVGVTLCNSCDLKEVFEALCFCDDLIISNEPVV